MPMTHRRHTPPDRPEFPSQVLRPRGLEQVPVHMEGKRVVRILAMRRDKDDAKLRKVATKDARELKPIHSRHLHVKQDDVEAARADDGKRLGSAQDPAHLRIGKRLARGFAGALARGQLVVNDQNPHLSIASPWRNIIPLQYVIFRILCWVPV